MDYFLDQFKKELMHRPLTEFSDEEVEQYYIDSSLRIDDIQELNFDEER